LDKVREQLKLDNLKRLAKAHENASEWTEAEALYNQIYEKDRYYPNIIQLIAHSRDMQQLSGRGDQHKSPSPDDRVNDTASEKNALNDYLVELAEALDEHFDKEELCSSLCFRLDIDYDDLRAEGKTNQVRELVRFCKRRGRIPELVEVAKQERPHIAWKDAPKALLNSSEFPSPSLDLPSDLTAPDYESQRPSSAPASYEQPPPQIIELPRAPSLQESDKKAPSTTHPDDVPKAAQPSEDSLARFKNLKIGPVDKIHIIIGIIGLFLAAISIVVAIIALPRISDSLFGPSSPEINKVRIHVNGKLTGEDYSISNESITLPILSTLTGGKSVVLKIVVIDTEGTIYTGDDLLRCKWAVAPIDSEDENVKGQSCEAVYTPSQKYSRQNVAVEVEGEKTQFKPIPPITMEFEIKN
jgi:hypothetical protein